MTENLFNRIKELYPGFSKGQKKLADYILEHGNTCAFMTASGLGKEAGVSESTAVRFAAALGFEGFPQFHKALAQMVQVKLELAEKPDIFTSEMSEDEVLRTILKSDINNIQKTLEMTQTESFRLAVETISEAKDIYVLGIRTCAPLASYLGFYLHQIFPHVHVITTSNATEVFEQLLHVREDDVVIGISFPRYSLRTLKAMEYANNQNAKVISVTDNIHSPMNLYSSCNLLAPSDMTNIVDSLTAPMSLLNALIVSIFMDHQKRVKENLEAMEEIWNDYQVYRSDEIDFYSGDKMKLPGKGTIE